MNFAQLHSDGGILVISIKMLIKEAPVPVPVSMKYREEWCRKEPLGQGKARPRRGRGEGGEKPQHTEPGQNDSFGLSPPRGLLSSQ